MCQIVTREIKERDKAMGENLWVDDAELARLITASQSPEAAQQRLEQALAQEGQRMRIPRVLHFIWLGGALPARCGRADASRTQLVGGRERFACNSPN